MIRNLQKQEFKGLVIEFSKLLLEGESLLGKNGVLCSANGFKQNLPSKFRSEDGEAQYRRMVDLIDEETGLVYCTEDGVVLQEERMTVIRTWTLRKLWTILAQRQAWLVQNAK